MEYILAGFLFLLFMIIVISILNEKLIKIPNDIALVLFAFIFSAVIKVLQATGLFSFSNTIIDRIQGFNFQEFLMDGILCFMLFAGASGVNFNRFVINQPFGTFDNGYFLIFIWRIILSCEFGAESWIFYMDVYFAWLYCFADGSDCSNIHTKKGRTFKKCVDGY